eukprot:gene7957-biopygen11738
MRVRVLLLLLAFVAPPATQAQPAAAPPLVFRGEDGCGPAKCAECEGDCDTDGDCQQGLVCMNTSNEIDIVPGCGHDSYQNAETEYCYQPCF